MANIVTINEDNNELRVSVTVSNSEYDTHYENELENIAKSAKLDGFRKGKVPKNILKSKYDAQCHQKSISDIIDLHTKKINLEKNLDLIESPSVKLIETPSNNKELSFEITFNKMPDIDIAKIKTIKLSIPEVDIQDEDVNTVISNIQKQNSTWESSDKPAVSGNKLVVDYEGKIDGKDFDNNKQEDFSFIIDEIIKGDKATVELFKQFSEQCLNKTVNTEVEFSHKMPNDFPDKNLCGKTIIYYVMIKKILNGNLPKLDKDFFTKLGIDTEDINIFKQSVKNHMEFELKDKLMSLKYGLVNDALVNGFIFEPPKAMVEKHETELSQQYASLKNNDKDMSKEIHDIAVKRVKLNIIFIRLVKEINSDISDNSAIDFCNQQSPSFRRFYSEKLKKDKSSTLMDIKNKMIENDIIEYVISKSDFTMQKKTFSEVMDG